MSPFVRLSVVATSSLVIFATCGDDDSGDPNHCTATANVTYDSHIQSIFMNHCTTCHSATAANRNSAPPSVNFDIYAEAMALAARANNRIQAGTMPPSLANNSVSAADACLFQDWVNQGTKEK